MLLVVWLSVSGGADDDTTHGSMSQRAHTGRTRGRWKRTKRERKKEREREREREKESESVSKA